MGSSYPFHQAAPQGIPHPDCFAHLDSITHQPIKLLHLTDCHLRAEPNQTLLGINTDESLERVLQDAQKHGWPPAAILLTGDLVQDVCSASYARLKQRLNELKVPCYCLPGNHDDPRVMRSALGNGNTRYQSQVLLGPWQIICLDSTIPGKAGGYLAAEQLALLESLLSAQPDRHALIALHHHPLAVGSPWLDTMILSNADALFAVLERHSHARAIIYGHIHQVQDAIYRGLRILASPATCFQFKPLSKEFALDRVPAGYRWLQLYPDGTIDTYVRRLDALPKGLAAICSGY